MAGNDRITRDEYTSAAVLVSQLTTKNRQPGIFLLLLLLVTATEEKHREALRDAIDGAA